MDQNRDGILDENDLMEMYKQTGNNHFPPLHPLLTTVQLNWRTSLNFPGQDPDPKKLKEMIKESDAQLNFTHFLNMFGARLGGEWRHHLLSQPHPTSLSVFSPPIYPLLLLCPF